MHINLFKELKTHFAKIMAKLKNVSTNTHKQIAH